MLSFLSAFLLSHIESGSKSCWFNLQNISRILPLLILPIIISWFKSPSYLTELFQQPPTGSPFFCSNVLQAVLSTFKGRVSLFKKERYSISPLLITVVIAHPSRAESKVLTYHDLEDYVIRPLLPSCLTSLTFRRKSPKYPSPNNHSLFAHHSFKLQLCSVKKQLVQLVAQSY